MKTNSKLIDLIVSQQERQKEYFLEYLRVQDLERIDLKNERYDDLRIHLDVEQFKAERHFRSAGGVFAAERAGNAERKRHPQQHPQSDRHGGA